MHEKGSITAYLSLILVLMISLLLAGLYSVQLAGARVQMVSAVDQGLYSLFARYDRTLLERYQLFYVDGSRGQGDMQMGKLYGTMEEDIARILFNRVDGNHNGNIGDLVMQGGGITGYTLATDSGGSSVKEQAAAYMKASLGAQGVRLLLEKNSRDRDMAQNMENARESIEAGESLDQYDHLKEQAEQEQEARDEAGEEMMLPEAPEDFVNPIETVRELKQLGILSLVLPDGKELSGRTQELSALASGRKLETGMGMYETGREESGVTEEILFGEYILQHCGNFSSPQPCEGLAYQAEYIIQGNHSDIVNLKGVVHKLLLMREAANLLHLYQDQAKRAQTRAAAGVIASLLLLPEAVPVVEQILLVCWAYAESILDVRGLLAGEKVPAFKEASSWQLTLSNIPRLLDGADDLRKNDRKGMSYNDYLRILLGIRNSRQKMAGCLDMIEMGMRAEEGKSNFRMDCCLYTTEVQFSFIAGKGNTYEVIRGYGYDM
ncbi:DUF5702 domain-containing protein [Ruminococcus sp. OA3]|uniref:DUF5702 domain-containing protein n=1 Tax=Ruminococcus sp. OA3 TaxID=2914164 RepID=UPI001F06EB66|nr:DUF5702 domain-containing protein [Ruminococcus sp. OA3]MCH1981110.1 DUF5702 domain-containing protein [Ruminococcus sp. OA3]